MPAPTLQSAFLSVKPLEPVLVFATSDDASHFQSRCKQGRILANQHSNWVFLPMPEGLLRVRTARRGDVAFEFSSREGGKRFNDSIGGLGRIFANTKEKQWWDRTVYLGRESM